MRASAVRTHAALLVCLVTLVLTGSADQSRVRLRLVRATSDSTSLVPADSQTLWNPGVNIPTSRTQCGSTILASTYGDGASAATAGIQAAIDACPVGQEVRLGAGTFRVDTYILINKGITLRGAGPDIPAGTGTVLQKFNVNQNPVIIVGRGQFPSITESTAVNLTADGVKGDYSVTVTDATGFAVGQFVKLDEDAYDTSVWTEMTARVDGVTGKLALMSDRLWWPVRCDEAVGVCEAGDPPGPDGSFPELLGNIPIPAGLSWHSRRGRPIAELKEVVGVSGNTITFADPIHITYRVSHTAQLSRYTSSSTPIRDAGVEDLTLQGGGDGNIQFLAAAYSWAKNIESSMAGNPSVDVKHGFRIEIRDSWIHDTQSPYPGGGGYLMSFQQGSSECLVENNVITGGNKVMVFRSAGAGSVVGYNYVDNAVIGNTLGWMEVGINPSHMVGSHHVLFEGNRSFNYDSDNTWGSAIYMTIFRNHLTGTRRDYTTTAGGNPRAGGLNDGSWWQNFIGNVLGESGVTTAGNGWIYEDPGDGTYGNATSAWGISTPAIWRLGYSTVWQRYPDPLTRSRLIRDGNYDYLSNSVNWDRAVQTIPDSLYLSAKPSFFGSDTWPWVDAAGSTKIYTLPAHTRGEALLAAATVPGQPRIVSATRASATSVAVDWNTPLESGGTVITTYTITASPGGATQTAQTASGTTTFTGLTTGVSYTFTVKANNKIGASAPSDPTNAVTP